MMQCLIVCLGVLALVCNTASAKNSRTGILNTVEAMLKDLSAHKQRLHLPEAFHAADGGFIPVHENTESTDRRQLFGELYPIAIPSHCSGAVFHQYGGSSYSSSQYPETDASAGNYTNYIHEMTGNAAEPVSLCFYFQMPLGAAIGVNTNSAMDGADVADIPMRLPLGGPVKGTLSCKDCYSIFGKSGGDLVFKVECEMDMSSPADSTCRSTIGFEGFSTKHTIDVQALTLDSDVGSSTMHIAEGAPITVLESNKPYMWQIKAVPIMYAQVTGSLDVGTSFDISSSYVTDYKFYTKCINNQLVAGNRACGSVAYAPGATGEMNSFAPAIQQPAVTPSQDLLNNYDVQMSIISSIKWTITGGLSQYQESGTAPAFPSIGQVGATIATTIETPMKASYNFKKVNGTVTTTTSLVTAASLWMLNYFNSANYEPSGTNVGPFSSTNLPTVDDFKAWSATSISIPNFISNWVLVIFGRDNEPYKPVYQGDEVVASDEIDIAITGSYDKDTGVVDLAPGPNRIPSAPADNDDGKKKHNSKGAVVVASIFGALFLISFGYIYYKKEKDSSAINAAKGAAIHGTAELGLAAQDANAGVTITAQV